MKKILIIDDEIEIVELIETLLEMEYEAEIIKANDGKEGIDKIKSFNDIDLIISDVNMPEVGGREVFQSNLENKNTAFIIMTGSDDLEVEFVEKFSNANPHNRVLPKPWKPEHLLQVISDVLEDKISA